MDNKKTITILMTLTVIITIIGGTFAYWNWQSTNGQKTNVTFTVAAGFTCGADAGGNITNSDVTLAPATCTNSEYAIQRTVRVNTEQDPGKTIALDMWLKVNSIGSGLSQSENFKYALTTNNESCEDDVIASGTFNGAVTGSQFNLLEDKKYASTTSNDTYYLYIWLDAAETSQSTMNQTFNITVEGMCTDEADGSDNVDPDNMLYAYFGSSGRFFKDDMYRNNITSIEFVNYTNTDGLGGLGLTNSVNPSYIPSNMNNFSVKTVEDDIWGMKFPLGIRGSVLTPATGTASAASAATATGGGSSTYDIMGWFEEDTNSAGNYTLKIGTNGNKIYTGQYMSYAFSDMPYVTEIKNIDMLDTRYTKYMDGMFYKAGENATNWSLDLGNHFNTSNVTNMYGMFRSAGHDATDFSLNLGNQFNASNVTDMTWIFSNAGRNATNFSLNLGNHFNTSNVIYMSGMFSQAGYNATNFSLDLGNYFNTSNVIYMHGMFEDAGRYATNFSLNLGNNFNTINATSMISMFSDAGQNATTWSLNLGNQFNTSNVTDMYHMFRSAGSNATTFSLNLGNQFNTSNVTDMDGMFSYAGKKATAFYLNLGSQFDMSNVSKLSYYDTVLRTDVGMFQDAGQNAQNPFTLDLSAGSFDKVTNYTNAFRNFGNNKATIYVKDGTAQNWIIDKNSEWGTNFSASNVLIK